MLFYLRVRTMFVENIRRVHTDFVDEKTVKLSRLVNMD